jgi:hypothetical protein
VDSIFFSPLLGSSIQELPATITASLETISTKRSIYYTEQKRIYFQEQDNESTL